MILFEKIKKLMLNAGLEKEDLKAVTVDIEKTNRQNLQIYSVIIVLYLGVLMVVACFNSVAKLNFWYYFSECMVAILIFVLSTFVNKKNSVFTMILVYLFMTSLLLFSILIGSVTIPGSKAVIYPAILFVVPLLFIDRPYRFDILLTLSVITYVILGILFKDRDVFYEDLLNVTVLYLMSVVISAHILKVKYKNLIDDRRLAALSEIDVLTNTQNRNCFENRIDELEKRDNKNSQLIFVDVNGLHEVNNTLGHAAGDDMLKFIAWNLRDIFGNDKCYRIGGDEFIVLNVDDFDDKIDDKITDFRSIIEKKDYHVSIGYEKSMEHVPDFTILTKQAENKMYEEKKEYYRKNNISGSIR